jgi:hypothetical protein
MNTRTSARHRGPVGRRRPQLLRRRRLGGVEGNEILTSVAAVVLVGLLIAEGITIVHMHGLLSAHMFIGLVLIPPVGLKLASTGYRMVSYYAGAGAYREIGPPLLPLRLIAPVLVAMSFIVFGVLLAVHFLAYVPGVVR